MKMHRLMRFSASVFLSLFILITTLSSCGIPVFFNVDTSIGKLEDGKVTVTISDSNGNLSLVDPATGPSLFLAYLVTDDSSLADRVESNIIADFKKTYQRASSGGMHIPIRDDGEPILNREEDDSTYPYVLYPFSADAIVTTTYHATATNHLSPNATVTLVPTDTDNPDEAVLSLVINPGSYTIHVPALQRYTGQNFSRKGGALFRDYLLKDEPLEDRWIHIFGAINVSVGKFTTIYWSDLTYFGSLKLDSMQKSV